MKSLAALGATVVLLTAGCGAAEDPSVAHESLGLHQVILSGPTGPAIYEIDPAGMLGELGFDRTDSALATMKWFLASDCSTPAPVTDEFVAACDSDATEIFLLNPAVLTAEDVASARVTSGVLTPDDPNTKGQLALTFTDHGASTLSALTAAAWAAEPPGNQIAMVVDGVVVTAPEVTQQITGGEVQIVGNGPDQDWSSLVAWLNAQPKS